MSTVQFALTKRLQASMTNRRRLRRPRWIILIIVGLVALLSTAVAIGQASQNFAISCGSVINSGGGVTISANFGAITAIGVPIAPPNSPSYAVRSPNFGLRSGFIPGNPTSPAVAAANAPSHNDLNVLTHMPFIAKLISIAH